MWRVCSVVTKDCEAKFCLTKAKSPLEETLKANEVIVKVEAAPINPSDLGLILPAGTDAAALATLKPIESETEEGVTYSIDKKYATTLSGRFDHYLPCGNEGAGVVVKAGSDPKAQRLVGKVVAVYGGKTYSQYKKASYTECIEHNEGTTPEEAASSYINPMTVLGFLETMKSEGHSAIIHTAAASNLGQMLQKICNQENIPLVNIVRKDEQEKILEDIGAKYVVRLDKPSFMKDLIAAIIATKATLAFDAIGGGTLAGQILSAMEFAAMKYSDHKEVGPYGTSVVKQVYIYGGLDRGPTIINRNFGLTFHISGWLMPRRLAQCSPEIVAGMYKKVADNIKTLFASEYYKRVSLAEVVQMENFVEFIKQETGKKFLVMPNKGIEQLEFKL